MYLLCYDITRPKRLREVAKILNRYGRRVQKSVYECDIDERQYHELRTALLQIGREKDAISAYRLPNRSAGERLAFPPAIPLRENGRSTTKKQKK